MKRPVARPIASSQTLQTRWSDGGSDEITAAKDSASLVSSRVSAAQLAEIATRLSDDDRAVLAFLGDVRLATGLQLARRLWAADGATDPRARSARRALQRLENLRLLERLERRMGGVRGGSSSIVYCLGRAGHRLLAREGGTNPRLAAPGARYFAHTLAITELVVRLHESTLRGDLDVLEVQTEPRCWRPFLGAMGAPVVLKPDLFLRIGAGACEDRWFVELDLATEAAGTLQSKARRYRAHLRAGTEQADHGVYPRVIWAVPDRRRGEQVTDALGVRPLVVGLFAVWCVDEVVGRLAAEAAS